MISPQNRGLRNNNPGNIRLSNLQWQGKKSKADNTDGSFEQFGTMDFGIRALIMLLQSYYVKYNLKTIRGILNRYAPKNENDTDGYVAKVSAWTGIKPDVVFPWTPENVSALIKSIIRMETSLIITQSVWQSAWDLTTGKKKIQPSRSNFDKIYMPFWRRLVNYRNSY